MAIATFTIPVIHFVGEADINYYPWIIPVHHITWWIISYHGCILSSLSFNNSVITSHIYIHIYVYIHYNSNVLTIGNNVFYRLPASFRQKQKPSSGQFLHGTYYLRKLFPLRPYCRRTLLCFLSLAVCIIKVAILEIIEEFYAQQWLISTNT